MRSDTTRWRAFGVLLFGVLLAAGCSATADPPPEVYRGAECAYSQEIQDAWAGTGDEHWAVDVAIRESRCDPCAFNPGQSDCDADPRTARGLFQLLGHGDLEHAACPLHPLPWSVPECGIAAARMLYDGAGRSPWR